MINFFTKLLAYIYKRKCYTCAKTFSCDIICPDCKDKVIQNLSFGSLKKQGINIYYAAAYRDEIKKIIRAIKYHKKREFAPILAEMLRSLVEQLKIPVENYEVCFVPIHPHRFKKRKYNHMELVANEFARKTNLQVNNNLITRVKDTPPMYKLHITERKKALNNAFKVNFQNEAGKKIILIDDIVTTGTTVSEIVTSLKKQGFKDIIVLSISCGA
ncbi:MAG: ComF family protein [Candidatus Gastranaerophilales bacterium]|nr:ComF family protein [Candidatus Gastranaerophilales bacterium]